MCMTGMPRRVCAMSFTALRPQEKKHFSKITSCQKGPLFAFPKVDGIRCLATTNGLFTKNGHPITTLFHVQSDIFRVLYREYKDFDPHSIVLDGELYAYGKSSINELLQAMRCHPLSMDLNDMKTQQKIKYHVSDVYFLESSRKAMPFRERRKHLQEILEPSLMAKLRNIIPVKSTKLTKKGQYERLLDKYIKHGSDGIIMYHPDGQYEPRRRSTMVWKHLPRHTAWYSVVQVYQNKMGPSCSFVCLTAQNKKFTVYAESPLLKKLPHKHIGGYEVKVRFYKLMPSGVPRFGTATALRRKRNT